MKINYLHIFSALLILGGTSCKHKDLCYPEPSDTGKVKVVVDWGKHAEEWKDTPSLEPQNLRLYLYPKDGGEPLIYDFSNIKGGMLPNVPAGEYAAILVNNASGNIDFDGTAAAATFTAATPTAPLAENLGLSDMPSLVGSGIDKEINDAPDRFWADYLSEVDLNDVNRRDIELRFSPDNMLRHYTVIAESVENIHRLTLVSGSLSGMSSSVKPMDNGLDDSASTLPFSLEADKEKRRLTASFRTFGPADTMDDRHFVTLYVELDNGNRAQLTFDVTEQVHGSPDPNNVVITLHGIDLLSTIPVGGGLNTSVDGWTDESVDLDM